MEGGIDMESVVADPSLIGEEVLPESLHLHATLPTQTFNNVKVSRMGHK